MSQFVTSATSENISQTLQNGSLVPSALYPPHGTKPRALAKNGVAAKKNVELNKTAISRSFFCFKVNILCIYYIIFRAKFQIALKNCHLKLKTGLRKVKNRTLVEKTAFCWHS